MKHYFLETFYKLNGNACPRPQTSRNHCRAIFSTEFLFRIHAEDSQSWPNSDIFTTILLIHESQKLISNNGLQASDFSDRNQAHGDIFRLFRRRYANKPLILSIQIMIYKNSITWTTNMVWCGVHCLSLTTRLHTLILGDHRISFMQFVRGKRDTTAIKITWYGLV